MDDKKAIDGSEKKQRSIVSKFKRFVSLFAVKRLNSRKLFTVSVALLAFVIAVSVILVKCTSSDKSSVNNTETDSIVLDNSDSSEDNSNLNNASDNPSLHVNTEKKENEFSNNSVTSEREVSADDNSSETAPETTTGVTPMTSTYVMYCGKFSSQNNAEEKKANIAISTGLSSKIISKGSFYSVLLGPFNTRDEAVATFNKLDSLKLIDECELEEQN